ncbi:MAG: nuclear transport factor 2 family protein [Bryobacteraceae bacterium]|nr:nuclear transport factor 2 family protein [Bryobacteraceae bacterium]
MKLLIPVTLVATTLCIATAVLAQTGSESDIRKAEETWAAAVKAGDRTGLAAMLSDDLIYTHSSGVVEDKGQYLDKLKTGSQKYTGIDYSGMKIRSWHGNTGVVNTMARMTGATSGVPFDNTVFLQHVWVKQGSMWKLVAHQTTKKP